MLLRHEHAELKNQGENSWYCICWTCHLSCSGRPQGFNFRDDDIHHHRHHENEYTSFADTQDGNVRTLRTRWTATYMCFIFRLQCYFFATGDASILGSALKLEHWYSLAISESGFGHRRRQHTTSTPLHFVRKHAMELWNRALQSRLQCRNVCWVTWYDAYLVNDIVYRSLGQYWFIQ